MVITFLSDDEREISKWFQLKSVHLIYTSNQFASYFLASDPDVRGFHIITLQGLLMGHSSGQTSGAQQIMRNTFLVTICAFQTFKLLYRDDAGSLPLTGKGIMDQESAPSTSEWRQQ
jgi:hypothetical protein